MSANHEEAYQLACMKRGESNLALAYIDLGEENARLREELDRAKQMPMKYRRMEFNAQLQKESDELREQLAAAQAKIDSLMFEYCPDEMTPEQIAEWGKWQRPIDSDKQAAIDEAVKENGK